MGGKRFSFNVTIKEDAPKEINTLVKSNTIQDSDIPVKAIKVISDKCGTVSLNLQTKANFQTS